MRRLDFPTVCYNQNNLHTYTVQDTSKMSSGTKPMDQEKAKVLFDHGAIFLLLNFPEGSEFGIDNYSWTVGPKFRGIKMIPPGVHFIYYSSVNADQQTSPRSGFFYNFSEKEVVVRKWNLVMEDVDKEEVCDEELKVYSENKQQMDKFLGPYPYDRYKHWVSLSSHVTSETVRALQPDCGCVYACTQFQSEASTSQSRKADRSSDDNMHSENSSADPKPMLPDLKTVVGTSINYSHIPKQRYPPGSSPSEITKYSMDSSYALRTLLKERYLSNIELLLGEVQFAFICFLLGQNYESFEQWKKLVNLLCTSGEAAAAYPDTYVAFITLLHFQIREISSDFFVDIVTSNNFLVVTLHELFQNLEADGVSETLAKKGRSFQKHLTDKFHWDFMSEPDEFAPVVVDT